MKRISYIICLLLPLLWAGVACAGTQFPALTGRVVDDAHLLSPNTMAQLTQELADYERKTTNQVVVVTLPSLQGQSIEDFGYQLGRHWGIGQKGKDNGVLLVVAPHERKVRIEVGYGLEGTLTDGASSQIVHDAILPDFKAGHIERGIVDGTESILAVLNGMPIPQPWSASSRANVVASGSSQSGPPANEIPLTPAQKTLDMVVSFIFIGVFIAIFVLAFISVLKAPQGSRNAVIFNGPRIGAGGGGFSGGGFHGGGGGFGGGGCSGGW